MVREGVVEEGVAGGDAMSHIDTHNSCDEMQCSQHNSCDHMQHMRHMHHTADDTLDAAHTRCLRVDTQGGNTIGSGGGYMTGDMVRRDGQGLLWFVGRAQGCEHELKVMGVRLNARHVEDVILQALAPHVAAVAVAVVPVAHAAHHSLLAALVVPASHVKRACHVNLSNHECPASLDSIPPLCPQPQRNTNEGGWWECEDERLRLTRCLEAGTEPSPSRALSFS